MLWIEYVNTDMCKYFLLNTHLIHWELEVFSSIKTEFRSSADQAFPL